MTSNAKTTGLFSYAYERVLQWSECDPAGIIYFPHYTRWMDEGLFAMFSSAGIDPNRSIGTAKMTGTPCVSVNLAMRSAPKLREVVLHEMTFSRLGSKSFSVRHCFLRGEELLAEGEETRVWAEIDLLNGTLSGSSIPDDVRDMITCRGNATG